MTHILTSDIGAIRGEIYLDTEKKQVEKIILFSRNDKKEGCMVLTSMAEIADVGSVMEDLGRQVDELLDKQEKEKQ